VQRAWIEGALLEGTGLNLRAEDIDALILGDGIAVADVTPARGGSGADDLLLSIAGGTDRVTVQSYFGKDIYGSYSARRVEEIRFGDGSIWTYAEVFALVTAPTNGGDTIHGDDFVNALGGLSDNDLIFGRLGADTLSGDTGADTLDGGDGADSLVGGDGNDSLFGGAFNGTDGGADTLEGGAGADTLTGGGGADVFRFASPDDSTAAFRDSITDFSAVGGDLIDLSALDADVTTAGDQTFRWLGVGVAFDSTPGALIGSVVGSDLELRGDYDGDNSADFVLLLKSITTMTASALVL
jgi:Ca2+-binding RTX toxin-like protein